MEAVLLKKYKLKNLAKGQKHMVTGLLGTIYIPQMTDEQAEKLYENGSRHFIAKAKRPPVSNDRGRPPA